MKPYAKKRWGQNFLIDPNILRKIISVIQPKPNEVIAEIGSGRGALTEYLVASGAQIHAIEIDPRLVGELREKFADLSNFQIHHEDALETDFRKLAGVQKLRVVGNIPYNITSPLLFRLFDRHEYITDIHFLMQKEVARRITAQPNSREYGILAVLTSFYGKAYYCFEVSPNVFRPIPKVSSAELQIRLQPRITDNAFRKHFHTVVRAAFGKRRKTLHNALAELLPANRRDCPINPQRRAETLTPEEFIALTQWIAATDLQ